MEDQARLRIGIVGGGFMGRRHAETIGRVAGLTLTGIADPFSTQLADARGVAAFSTHEELADSGVDAVIIANPNDVHVPTALDMHARGIPVLVEKPLATSLAQLQPLLEIAGDGAPILVGHHRRHHPAVVQARELLAAGALGQITTIAALWAARKADTYFEPEWRRRPGAGVVLINAVHDLDLLRTLFGEFASVRAEYSSAQRGLPVPDSASIVFRTVGGALGTYVCSDAAVSPWSWDQGTNDEDAFPFTPDASCYFVAGTEASLTFPQLLLHRHTGTSDWNHPLWGQYVPVAHGDSYTRQLEHFAAVARGEVGPAVTVQDVAETMRLVDAVERSASSGETISLR